MGERRMTVLVRSECPLVKEDARVKLIARFLMGVNWFPVWWWCLHLSRTYRRGSRFGMEERSVCLC